MAREIAKYNYKPDIGLLTSDLKNDILNRLPHDLKDEFGKEFKQLPLLLNDGREEWNIPLKIIGANKTIKEDNFLTSFFDCKGFAVMQLQNPYVPAKSYDLYSPISFYFVGEKETEENILNGVNFLEEKSLKVYIITNKGESYNLKKAEQIEFEELKKYENIKQFFERNNIPPKRDVLLCFAQIFAVQNFIGVLEDKLKERFREKELQGLKVSSKITALRSDSEKKRFDIEEIKKIIENHLTQINRDLKQKLKSVQSDKELPSIDFNNHYTTKKLDNKRIITPSDDMLYSFNTRLQKRLVEIDNSLSEKNKSFIKNLKNKYEFDYALENIVSYQSEDINEDKLLKLNSYKEEFSQKGFMGYFYKLYRPFSLFSIIMLLIGRANLPIGEIGENINSFIERNNLENGVNIALFLLLGCALYWMGKAIYKLKEQEKHERNKKREVIKEKMLKDFNSKIEMFCRNQAEEYRYYSDRLNDTIQEQIIKNRGGSFARNEEKREGVKKETNSKELSNLNTILGMLSKIKQNSFNLIQLLRSDFKQAKR